MNVNVKKNESMKFGMLTNIMGILYYIKSGVSGEKKHTKKKYSMTWNIQLTGIVMCFGHT